MKGFPKGGAGSGSQVHGRAKPITQKIQPPHKKGDPVPQGQRKFNDHGRTPDK